jgi:hypothetical protein
MVPETPQRGFPVQSGEERAMVITLASTMLNLNRTSSPSTRSLSLLRPPFQSEVLGYVVNTGSNTITIFDKMQLQATGAIATGMPAGIALDRRLKRAYVILSGEDTIEVLDLNTQSVSQGSCCCGETIRRRRHSPRTARPCWWPMSVRTL